MGTRAAMRAELAARLVQIKANSRAIRYGVTTTDLSNLMERQNHCCGICQTPVTVDTAHVDHDHTYGTVRGFLCPRCNRLLGSAKDSTAILRSAIEYLENNLGVPSEITMYRDACRNREWDKLNAVASK